MQVVGEGIGRPERNNAQGCAAADHPLQNVVYGAVAAAGEDGVAAFCDGLARLIASFSLSARRLGGDFDSGLLQYGQRCLNVRQPPLVARPGERVIEEKRPYASGSTWESDGLYWKGVKLRRRRQPFAPSAAFY